MCSVMCAMCARRARLCLDWSNKYTFIDESMAVQIFFIYLFYGITHGFVIKLDLLLMAWNFKDILRFVFSELYR